MYDLNGNLVQEFNSISHASEVLNISRHKITSGCKKQHAFTLINYKRYIFRYNNDRITNEELIKANSIKSDPRIKVMAIDSETEQIIGIYDSISQAAREFNISKSNIIEAIGIKYIRNTAGKFNGHKIK